jgi:hypothetical protein
MPQFTDFELNLFREWFNAMQDIAPQTLEQADYILAEKVHMTLGREVPQSIRDGARR